MFATSGPNVPIWWAETERLIESFHSKSSSLKKSSAHPSSSASDESEIENLTCSECGHLGMNENEGLVFCGKCGTLNTKTASLFDISCEWKSFGGMGGKPDQSRCGMPTNPLLPNSGMSTLLVGGGNSYVKKIHKWNSLNHKDVAKYRMYIFIQNQATRSGISSAIIQQAQTYAVQLCDKMTEEDNIMRGKNRQGLLAACLYFAFKKLSCPRSIAEISTIIDLQQSCVSNGINLFSEFFMDKQIISQDVMTTPSQLIPRYCSSLRIPDSITELTLMTSAKVEEENILENNIVEARAASCIWFVVKISKSQSQFTKKVISDACGVSQATIAKCCKKIEDRAAKIVLSTTDHLSA